MRRRKETAIVRARVVARDTRRRDFPRESDVRAPSRSVQQRYIVEYTWIARNTASVILPFKLASESGNARSVINYVRQMIRSGTKSHSAG